MRKIALAFVAVALAGCGPNPTSTSQPSGPPPVAASLLTVSERDIPSYFEASGTVRAQLNAVLASKVVARVASVNVREGDHVKAGDVLVVLDTRELDAAVQVADANVSAARVGVENARTAHDMEVRTSAARIAQAQAALGQSRSVLAAAQSRLDLALAGPRSQERTQAHLAVVQAESSLRLAKIQLDRVTGLVAQGALPKKDLDVAQNGYEVAQAARDTAVQTEKISIEGTRSEEIRGAREGVVQARAAVAQSEAGLSQARGASLQARVRAEEVRVAQAQVSQSEASLNSVRVALGYATVIAPFDGWIVKRSVDPGAMATSGSPLLTIEGGDLRLEALVPESILPGVRLGAEIAGKVDAIGRDFLGKVAEIAPQGDPIAHTFLVKIALRRGTGIEAGMFGRALISTGHAKGIEIPVGATWQREGLNYVFVRNAEGIARLRIVTLGQSHDERVLVLSGLSPGESIVIGDREGVTDGSKVSPK